ncbi:penicillin-binding protein 1A [Rickettsia endosymbiont of Culicoides newsteadi]|uniref:penicillin-binding protein 1A n=1 Tax=Rickettsia endosymbiont of Culicoides newsteadi TaxID=1961830 RepID=UPI000B9C405E|nr:penicillin-binding protein 1A [Rickettsia endosymbiont of Culicoides newsteadi]OZG31765.1 peptidase [Rickettsia endosymbiont of Culicoides newsteadi]
MFKLFYVFFKLFLILGLIAISACIYLLYNYSKDLPDYSQLADYHPPSVTRVYAQNGKLMEEYALERRVFVPISSVPRSLIEAFISAEDKNFFEHSGVDIISIIRAAILNISNIVHHRRVEGGSTITQQVVKNFLLTSEVSIERKIKEAILSYMVSKTFTKDQILELYLNQTFFGRGAYGVAMAAQNYFNKSIDDLTLAESAFIAGLPKAPSNFNPEKNYARVKERRDYVIMRMLEDGYITQEIAKEAIDTAIILQKRDRSETVTAGYYAEQVREEVIRRIGSKEYFYTGGLTVITSLDANMQQAAENSLRKGIREYDRKHGFRGVITNIDINNWQDNLNKLTKPPAILEYQLAVVLNVSDNQAEIGLCDLSKSKIALSEMKWAKNNLKSAKTLLQKGDVIVVEKVNANYSLRQIPTVNGAIMVMNPTTGQVLASVGGYDFAVSKFDRVTQALRQPGSLSKTFVYLAALENAIQPNRIFEDGPVEVPQGPGMPVWRPKNYKGDFLGLITMRTGLEKSRNLITVRVAQSIGLNKVAEIIKRFGINNEPKRFYSMVLGSLETTLKKMITAYAIIANSGKKVTPHFVELIKDRNGKIIYRRDNRECENCSVSDSQLTDNVSQPILSQPDCRMITDEASDYKIVSFLTGAVERGTAIAAKKLGKIIAGKSGTTNESMDTWFIGFTPKIIVGTYIGYDTPKTLGKTATGSSVALPIFIDFMEKAYSDIPSLAFKIPESIKLLPVNPQTGKITSSGSIMEAFKTHDIQILDYQQETQDNDDFHNISPEKDNSQEVY